ncbi:MAG: RimK family alpha-L-glutamate ligase [Candidatus Bathyarchaeota archaeon]|nr:MAG: RimK family alpha-L-glutamate ligase [Candidatus Bathyarchaeota archaeon]
MVGILGRDINAWATTQLKEAFNLKGTSSAFFRFPNLVAKIRNLAAVSEGNFDISSKLAALIVRPMGRGSLEEVIFRMDLLHSLERHGVSVINSAGAIERCVDKYLTLALLDESGIPVPRTIVTENAKDALNGFHELGSDVILKPLFGSRGIGSTRISDENVATRIFKSVRFHHGVLYLQEFVPHGGSDIRAFVVGDRVTAAMRRVGKSWKTNVSQGARPVRIEIDEELESLAVRAAKIVGCKIAGVDILESDGDLMIIELNSQPGWRGLQSVTQFNIADHIADFVLKEVRKAG